MWSQFHTLACLFILGHAIGKSSQRHLQDYSAPDRSLPSSQKDCDYSSDFETCQLANHCCATITKNSKKEMACIPQMFHN